jgi:ferredoxin
MPELEEKIKEFARKAGANLVGIAGPGRFEGPPSINPAYEMRGAKSIVSIAVPLNVGAIYEFLGKVSPLPHNMDHTKVYQKIHRLSREIADYIRSLGYKAKAVRPNNTYRRSWDPFINRPTFSHRFGAVVSGLGAFGLSGNIVTKEYGAAVVLGTIVTNAKLTSDPALPARSVMDNRCTACRLCDKSCSMGMFRDDDEEYLLINGELHPRGKRECIDLCNAPCFGLHGISRDKKWTNWGQHWIKPWTDAQPDATDKKKVRQTYMGFASTTGDSFVRFKAIRNFARDYFPREQVEDLIPEYEQMTRDENERRALWFKALKNMGSYGLERDPALLTCGQCMLVCGADFAETKKRYDLLRDGGYVVPDADWKMVHVNTYEEAVALKAKYKRRVSTAEMMKDTQKNGVLWLTDYFGFEPIEEIKGLLYQARAKKACAAAGLAGKDAKSPMMKNPFYLFRGALPSSKRKKKRGG